MLAAHEQTVVEQFTQQALPFSRWDGQQDEMARLRAFCAASSEDNVLDVACGPGLVACAFAPHVRHVTGVDITPTMIATAERRQRENNLENMRWEIGSALQLPFADSLFSLVLTRYSFHHLLDPAPALAEMIRTCESGGRVMVVDVTPPADKADSYNRMEKRRDPSHVRALAPEELQAVVRRSNLRDVRVLSYPVTMDLERLMRASFPNADDAAEVRRTFGDDVAKNDLGLGTHLHEGTVRFAYPITAIVGTKGH
jgi:ubiquinone/menaquinone biosynthesis C-methylase UbiE